MGNLLKGFKKLDGKNRAGKHFFIISPDKKCRVISRSTTFTLNQETDVWGGLKVHQFDRGLYVSTEKEDYFESKRQIKGRISVHKSEYIQHN